MNSAVIIDIALLAVLLIGTAIGARRGLWASLAGFVIFLLALCGAALVAGSFTPKLVGAVQPVLEQHMERFHKNRIESAKILLEGLHFVNRHGQPLHMMPRLPLAPELLEQPLYH